MYEILLKVIQRLPETLDREEKDLLTKAIKKISQKYRLNIIFPGKVYYSDKPYAGYQIGDLE